jgi:hypothetical protein
MSEWKTPEENENLRRLIQAHRASLRFASERPYLKPPKLEAFKPHSLYICQVCFAHRAEWPRLKQRTFRLLWWSFAVTYVTPMVCTNCRMMRHAETVRLGDGRRRFWKQIIALWSEEMYPSMGPGMRRLFVYRHMLRGQWLWTRGLIRLLQEDLRRLRR